MILIFDSLGNSRPGCVKILRRFDCSIVRLFVPRRQCRNQWYRCRSYLFGPWYVARSLLAYAWKHDPNLNGEPRSFDENHFPDFTPIVRLEFHSFCFRPEFDLITALNYNHLIIPAGAWTTKLIRLRLVCHEVPLFVFWERLFRSRFASHTDVWRAFIIIDRTSFCR